ncbi:Por secretion system C-terminal sorting domain-containing protein [Mucilaginibacter gossypiicola]|uniref:Por secretion system C-terminal sorting domain-containing protein n=1 Tax=Mucilaginibacter gossypiicola TaxID=551995 RepID=A0A1H8PZS1_9SPHI|nr:S8 family serine peptidase [Mucilaginibacter gossypiicola]SEO47306.1 Por secretion system C-terminal sorting domain-containing protein [Mucilaginibacter gossypiicola]
MIKLYTIVFFGFLLLFAADGVMAQQPLISEKSRVQLNDISQQSLTNYKASHDKAVSLAATHGWTLFRRTKNGNLVTLQGVNKLGFPIYLITHNNTTAAATTGTNTLQPGGSLGLNLSGSSDFLANKLAIWDGGAVYKAHQEFAGKTITLKTTEPVNDHSSHVAGTMIAKGIYAPAKGMSFGATTLQSYDFNNDETTMSAAAANLLLSNHSYGVVTGWDYNDSAGRWEWNGLPGDTVDYNFGFYDTKTANWDKIAYTAPYYLIVESAGNERSSNGPAVGETYYGYKSRTDQTFVNKGARPAGISNNDGYDIISTSGNAKNILTVGAVYPLLYGPKNRSDVAIAPFSSWGPTDDGRIKPDIVGDGVNVLSVGIDNTTSYLTLSGTSMAAPNVTGSLYLLQEYYAKQNGGAFMRSATLKGLVCHTAFDAGNVGPDYIYGWGLLNMTEAAQALTDNGGKSIVSEKTVTQGQTQTFNVIASGNRLLAATISWTDPQGTATTEGVINSRTPKLVNDLDIRVSDGTTTFTPWVLDPDKPGFAATNGDNIRDNIEQVYIPNSVPGRAYTITVSHKGTLSSGSQAYSLIVTGVGGTAYCASAPLSGADSRVDNFKLANIDNTPAAGCKSYSDYTNLTVQLEQAKVYPLSITLGTCGNNFNKAAKVFIDWNANGVFEDNELAATTGIINGTGTYNTNITVPGSVVAGAYSLMRVVLTETSDASTIKACGNYDKGETQDYRVQFLQTSIDAGVIAIVSPGSSGSCSASTPVTVRIKNFGNAAINNIPITVTITDANNVTTTYNETYKASLPALAEDNFTFSEEFNAIAGASYTITATSKLAGDPVSSNNSVTANIVINSPASIGDLSAYYCATTKQYELFGTGDGTLLWYQNATDVLPIAAGSEAVTSLDPVNNTYYAGINDFEGTIGPATKSVFTAGGYNQFTPYVSVNTKVPVLIKSARLYIGNSGKITFNVSNSNGQIVSTASINAVATRTTALAGAQPDDPNDQGQVYDLNLSLPAAGDYQISVDFADQATIYRSNGGVTGYPFKIGSIFSITGNGATATNGDTTAYKGYYYYFYDMKVQSLGCASATRKAVTLSKPVVTQTNNTLNSNFTDGNQWLLNGNVISGATAATYDPVQSGKYQVQVTLANGCVAQSDNFVYAREGVTGSKSEIGLSAFPVPASTNLNVVFTAKEATTLKLSLTNALGESVYQGGQQNIDQGNYSTILNVSGQTPGVYVLRVLLGQKIYSQKVIITR